MIVGTLQVSMRIEGARSLKDKRQVLRSLMDRTRREFGVAIAEVGDQNLWGNAVVGAACLSTDPAHADSVLEHVLAAMDHCPNASVESVDKRIERV